MQNDYLSNKKHYNVNNHNKYHSQNYDTLKSKNVDINKLLNGVKINEKNIKKENWILFGLATLILLVTGIFISL